jgi:hypothetical protein
VFIFILGKPMIILVQREFLLFRPWFRIDWAETCMTSRNFCSLTNEIDPYIFVVLLFFSIAGGVREAHPEANLILQVLPFALGTNLTISPCAFQSILLSDHERWESALLTRHPLREPRRP